MFFPSSSSNFANTIECKWWIAGFWRRFFNFPLRRARAIEFFLCGGIQMIGIDDSSESSESIYPDRHYFSSYKNKNKKTTEKFFWRTIKSLSWKFGWPEKVEYSAILRSNITKHQAHLMRTNAVSLRIHQMPELYYVYYTYYRYIER